MAFAKKSVNKNDVKSQQSEYINTSGIYDVTILSAFVDTSAKGSSVVNFFIENKEQKQVLYGGLRVTNSDDENGDKVENEIGMKMFNHLLVIGDFEQVEDPVDGELPIGKGGANKTVAILEDLSGFDIKIRIQLEYCKYKDNIQERRVIRGFYRASDNATAEEIVNDENFGEGYEKDQKYVNNVTYKDGLTPEIIAAWATAGRNSSGDSGSSNTAAKTPSFGKPKRFSSKKN